MCVCVSVSGPFGVGGGGWVGVGNYRIQSYGVKGGGRLGGWESGVCVSLLDR